MLAGSRWQGISIFQQFLSHLMWPIQQTVDLPTQLIEQSQLFFGDRIALLTENSTLRQQQIYSQAQIQKLRSLEAENQELRELLRSVGSETESFFEARLIHANIDPFSQQILLNKGTSNDVKVGQPV